MQYLGPQNEHLPLAGIHVLLINERWLQTMSEDHAKMKRFRGFEAVLKSDVPPGNQPLSAVWAGKRSQAVPIKLESQQVVGFQDTASPVVNDTSVRVVGSNGYGGVSSVYCGCK